jgi:deazaflavin-dependent oxidoreductase (nitroreductase family)
MATVPSILAVAWASSRWRWPVVNSRAFYRLAKWPPQVLYALGLGPLIGRLVLLLTTTGRKSGRPRVTPLQYEEVDGAFCVGAARGEKTDWFRNILADSHVEVRLGSRRFRGLAEPITDPSRIADFLELRLRRHPKMVSTILRLEGLPQQPDRADLERYASHLAAVLIRPEGPLAEARPGIIGFARQLLKAVLKVVAILVGWLLFVQTVVRIVRRFFHFAEGICAGAEG